MPNSPQNQPDNSQLHDDIRRVIDAIGTNKSDTNARLDEIARKQQEIPEQFNQLRKELVAMFVPRSEYDPKHAILTDKVNEIRAQMQQSMQEAGPILQEYSVLKQTVKNNTDDIDEIRKRQAGTAGRVFPWIGAGVSVIALIITLLQHVHIT